jgi:hypothetical protein
VPQLVPIEDAARNTLVSWLEVELASVTGGMSIEARWSSPDVKLPPRRISIINRGPRSVEWLQPFEIVRSTNVDTENGSPVNKADFTYALAMFEQPLQLDVWARNEPEIQDIMARLDGALNRGANGLGVTNAVPFEAGLLRTLADGWAPGIVEFLFDSPDTIETPDSHGDGEFRAMYRGRVSGQLVQTARSVRIARVLLKQRLEGSPDTDTYVVAGDATTPALLLTEQGASLLSEAGAPLTIETL